MSSSIFSMTGFGRGEASIDNYDLTVEIKTVNNRFKDLRFKMGSIFSAQELQLRKQIDENFSRGSFEVSINYKRSENNQKIFDLDEVKVKSFVDSVSEMLKDKSLGLSANITDFLRPDFYVDESDQKEKELVSLLNKAFSVAVDELKKSRQSEGEKLLVKIKEHRDLYKELYDKVTPLKDQYRSQIEEKLNKKFKEKLSDLQIDDNRYHQEVIYYLERFDIDEEINRIDAHLKKLDEILNAGGEVGRKIDFLLQEFNRETNTIGSKSAHKEISDCVVEMKVQLEKMREQALNLE